MCKHPFLGADFLAHFNFMVNMKHRLLWDTETNISITGIHTRCISTGISTTNCHSTEFLDILTKYKYIMIPFKNTDNIKHDTKHQIKTTGHPVFSCP